MVSRPIAIIGAQFLRQSAGGIFQRLQSRFNFLFVVGILADMPADNDLQIGINANPGVIGIIKAAFFAHDACLGIGKAYWFFIVNDFAGVKLFFTLLKGLFGRFYVSRSGLFECQVFRDFIAGFILVGLVFVLVAALGFLNQVLNFGTQGLFLFL